MGGGGAAEAAGRQAHNPRLVSDPRSGRWLLYHIGTGVSRGAVKRCDGSVPPAPGPAPPGPAAGAAAGAPFSVVSSASLDGPWLAEGGGTAPPRVRRMTLYPGVSNVRGAVPMAPPEGGVRLYEARAHGNGSVLVPFGRFTARQGGLAWDACQGPPLAFDNGHPLEPPTG